MSRNGTHSKFMSPISGCTLSGLQGTVVHPFFPALSTPGNYFEIYEIGSHAGLPGPCHVLLKVLKRGYPGPHWVRLLTVPCHPSKFHRGCVFPMMRRRLAFGAAQLACGPILSANGHSRTSWPGNYPPCFLRKGLVSLYSAIAVLCMCQCFTRQIVPT